MTLAFSTSSPLASVALISSAGEVLWSDSDMTHYQAAPFLFTVLEHRQVDYREIDLFAADIGPGSFSGVRVGVTIAKTLAFANGKPVAEASAFDLISVDKDVVLPSKRGEHFLRRCGQEPIRISNANDLNLMGYPLNSPTYPHAENFAKLELVPMSPFELLPRYMAEPSISLPKVPYKQVVP